MTKTLMNAEQRRLDEARKGTPWRKWGPYLSERQWGTVREDYSENGDAWNWYGLGGVEVPVTQPEPFGYQGLGGLMKVW